MNELRTRNANADIVAELKSIIGQRAGQLDSDINVLGLTHPVPCWMIDKAIAEIERLQKFAGAVTSGHSVSEIKEMLRTPEGLAKLKENYEALPK
jgi:hypothetical protein